MLRAWIVMLIDKGGCMWLMDDVGCGASYGNQSVKTSGVLYFTWTVKAATSGTTDSSAACSNISPFKNIISWLSKPPVPRAQGTSQKMRPLLSSLSRATTFPKIALQKGLHQQQQGLSIFDSVCLRCRRQQLQFRQRQQRNFNAGSRRLHQQPADDPQWVSPIDRPSQIVRVGRRHGPGLILLGISSPLS